MKNKELGLTDLINKVKQDLLSQVASQKDPVPLFSIDEISVEIKFTLAGDISSGFDLVVVKLGSNVSEERVHTVTVKMSPILSKAEIVKSFKNDSELLGELLPQIRDAFIKGELDDAPPR